MPRIGAFIASLALTAVSLGGTAAAAYAPMEPKPQITLTADASVCGQVTLTAHGFAVQPGQTYIFVAGGTERTAKAMENTASITLAQGKGWGYAQIRTASGGYLASINELGSRATWYLVQGC